MNSRRDEEIAASVGAHRDLGSEYDDAIAAGLVERIGAEIDRRVDERISQYQPGGRSAVGHAGNSAPAASQQAQHLPAVHPGRQISWQQASLALGSMVVGAITRRVSTPTTEMEPGRSSSSGSPSSLSTWPSSAAAAPPDATAAPRTDRPAGCHSVVPHSGQDGRPACPASCSQVNSGRYQHGSRITSGITGGLQAPTPSPLPLATSAQVCTNCPDLRALPSQH
jgi:hypothetical protein